MRFRLLPLLCPLLLLSCADAPTPAPEAEGMKAVTAVFGGSVDTARRAPRNFVLTLARSAAVDNNYFPSNKHVASGAAYAFYEGLGAAAGRYDSIVVGVQPTGRPLEEATFSHAQLAEAASVMPFVQELTGRLRRKQYEGLANYFAYDPALMTRPLDSVLATLRAQTERNRYDTFQPTGFRPMERPGSNRLIVVSGLLSQDGGKPTPFSVAVDPASQPRKAYFALFALY
ncbi:hypothetical protein [Flaviaesturariibacter aridisoli]|uniref:Uncharacterized protein n=1 Tax=Flaviaesturariibacter aridisoli TaxID=2545761 RepID=A0A4R4DYD0_9BACT|nr:hypothetical protein [Flaviaesturariibacter aridisoli]TCZ70458.1 hypothetical protein E0486_10910 [Flaviaesturariibacter aridisoli]